MALYDTLFAMMDLQASQLLVTPRDFRDENFKINLRETTEELLSVARVIPVFNENDAISDRSKDAVGALLLPFMGPPYFSCIRWHLVLKGTYLYDPCTSVGYTCHGIEPETLIEA